MKPKPRFFVGILALLLIALIPNLSLSLIQEPFLVITAENYTTTVTITVTEYTDTHTTTITNTLITVTNASVYNNVTNVIELPPPPLDPAHFYYDIAAGEEVAVKGPNDDFHVTGHIDPGEDGSVEIQFYMGMPGQPQNEDWLRLAYKIEIDFCRNLTMIRYWDQDIFGWKLEEKQTIWYGRPNAQLSFDIWIAKQNVTYDACPVNIVTVGDKSHAFLPLFSLELPNGEIVGEWEAVKIIKILKGGKVSVSVSGGEAAPPTTQSIKKTLWSFFNGLWQLLTTIFPTIWNFLTNGTILELIAKWFTVVMPLSIAGAIITGNIWALGDIFAFLFGIAKKIAELFLKLVDILLGPLT